MKQLIFDFNVFFALVLFWFLLEITWMEKMALAKKVFKKGKKKIKMTPLEYSSPFGNLDEKFPLFFGSPSVSCY